MSGVGMTQAADGRLTLRLFGGFGLEDATGTPIILKLRKAEALLAYLAASPGQCASRQELADLLWGESDQQRARQSLRQTLLALGKALDGRKPPVLLVSGQMISLAPGSLSVDVQAFERLAVEQNSRSLTAAAAIYKGEFLAGSRLDAPGFEDWLAATRCRLGDLAMKALTDLLGLQEHEADVGAAIATARQVLRIDPFREDLHRRLMRLCARGGMRSSALAQFRTCRDILQNELGIAPDRETVALFESLLDGGQGADECRRDIAPVEVLPGPSARVRAAEADILESHYRLLASERSEAGRPSLGFAMLLAASRVEIKRGNPAAAERLLHVVPALPRGHREADLEADRHLLYALIAENRGALVEAHAALDAAELRSDPVRMGRVMIARSRLLGRAGDSQGALDCARRALVLYDGVDGEAFWLPVERFLAGLDIGPGGLDGSGEHTARALSQGEGLPASTDTAQDMALLALTRAAAGKLSEAQAECRQALDLARRLGEPGCLGACLFAQGLAALWAGDGIASCEIFGEALAAAEARGDLLRRYVVGGCLGAARLAAGEREAGLADLAQACDVAEQLDTRFLLAVFKSWIAAASPLPANSNDPGTGSIAWRSLASAPATGRPTDLACAGRAVRLAIATQRSLGAKAEPANSQALSERSQGARGGRPPLSSLRT